MLIANTLFSLFPLLSLFLAATIGIVHARHQKGRIFLFLFAGVIVYYALAIALQPILFAYTVPVLIFGWLIITYTLYKKNIVAKF